MRCNKLIWLLVMLVILVPTVSAGTYKWKNLSTTDPGAWAVQHIKALSYEPVNNLVFTGMGGGYLGMYNVSSNTWVDLSATDIDDWAVTGASGRTTFAIIAVNNTVYTGMNFGILAVYNISNNIWSNITVSPGSTYSLAYDSTNNLLYNGAYSGVFGFYNISSNTWTNLTETDTGNWVGTSTVNAVVLDSAHNLVYTGIAGGKFGVYNATSNIWTNLSQTDQGDWIGTNSVTALVFDTAHNLVYTGAELGSFGVYNATSGILINLSTTDTGNWVGTKTISSFAFDSVRNLVYTSIDSGYLGVYNATSNIWTNLSQTDPGDWVSTTSVLSTAYDSANNLLYTGLNSGEFGVLSENVAPEVSIINISSNDGKNLTSSNLTCGWAYSDTDGDTWSSTEIRWYNTSIEVASLRNSTYANSKNFSIGNDIFCSVRVNDATDWSAWSNSSIMTLLNTPPTLAGLSVTSTSGSNYTSDNITLGWVQSDFDVTPSNTTWFNSTWKMPLLLMSFDTNLSPIPDLSSFGNNGTTIGPVWTSAGKQGGAYAFDGIDDRVNITGARTTQCLQEYANRSTECGGLSTGIYGVYNATHWLDEYKSYDGNYSTWSLGGYATAGCILINYSKPASAIDAIWNISHLQPPPQTQLNIPQECFNQQIIQVRYCSQAIGLGTYDYYECFNGTGMYNLTTFSYGPMVAPQFLEEAMIWNITHSNVALDAGRELTIEAWVKRSGATETGNPGIISKDIGNDNANSREWYIYSDGAYSTWYAVFYNTSAVAKTLTCNNATSDNQWHHIAVTYNGTAIAGYFDGRACSQTQHYGQLRYGDAPIQIGKYYYTIDSVNVWNGTIDEVRIYNYSLSAGQINNHYNMKYNVLHSDETTKNDVWTGSALVCDSSVYADKSTASMTINNQPPSTPTTLSPDNNSRQASNSVTISCSGSIDADDDGIAYYIYAGTAESQCWQDTANVSNSCGALSTGDYAITSTDWLSSTGYMLKDTDWTLGTYAAVGTVAYAYVNYTIPTNALQNTTKWQVKDSDGAVNLTIPVVCWQNNKLQLMMQDYANIIETPCTYYNWSCYDGTQWVSLRTNSRDSCGSSADYKRLFEEGITWAFGKSLVQSNSSTSYSMSTIDGTRYYWKCQANDSTSYSANTTERTFLENTAPTSIDITAPANNTYKNVNSMFINITAGTDPEGDTFVYGIYTDTNTPPTTLKQNTSTTYYNYTGITDGRYFIKAVIGDGYEDNDTDWVITYVIDTTKPVYATNATVYANNSYLQAGSFIIAGALTETNFANITYWLYDSTWAVLNKTISSTATDLSFNFSTLPDGRYFYKVSVTDIAGNINATINQTFVLDTTLPQPIWIYPTVNNTRGTTNTVTINVSFIAEINPGNCLLDWEGTNESMTLSGNSCYKAKSALADGTSYTFKVYVNDTAGNGNVTGKLTWIENSKPNPVYLLVPANNSFISVNSSFLNVSAADTEDTTLYYGIYADTNNPPTTLRQNTSATYYNLTDLISGRYYWKAVIGDGYETNTTEQLTFTIDTVLPAVTLIGPENATSNISTTFTFTCNVTDNIDIANLTLYHNIGGSYVGNYTETAAGTDNKSVFLSYTLSDMLAGNYSWNCKACDDASNCAFASANFSLQSVGPNVAPIINISGLKPDPAYINSNLNCTITVTDLNEGDTLYANYTWYNGSEVYSSGQESAINGTKVSIFLGANIVKKGQNWNCSVTPYDSNIYGDTKTINLTISNSAPIVTINISSSDSKNQTNSNLTCGWAFSDSDTGDTEISHEIRWFNISGADNLEQTEDRNATWLNQLNTTKGEIWYCSVRVNDGTDWSSWYNTSNLTILNTAPVFTTVPGNTTNEDTTPDDKWFNISKYASDTDQPDTLVYTIYNHTNQSLIDCVITSTYYMNCSQPAGNMTGTNLVTVQASDGTDVARTPINVTVLAVNDVPDVDFITPVEGDNLRFNGSLGNSLNFIFATSDIDTATVSCEVWLNDTGAFLGRGTQTGINTGTATPTTGNISINTSMPDGAYTYYLNCNDGTGSRNTSQRTFFIDTNIPDWTINLFPAPDNSTLVSWYLPLDPSVYDDALRKVVLNITNGSAVSFYSNLTDDTALSLLAFSEIVNTSNWTNGIYIIELFADDDGASNRTESYQILVDRLPVVTAVNLSIDDPTNRTNGNLTCRLIVSDWDGDTLVSNETKWYKNSIELTALKNITWISAGNTTRDNTWFCSARANDGLAWGNWTNSSVLTIMNTPPLTTINITSNDGTNRTKSNLTASWTYSDADGDVQASYELIWYNNSVEVTSLRNATTVTGGNTTKSQYWMVSIRVNDNAEWSTWSNSGNLTILNTIPTSVILVTPDNETSTGDNTVFFDWTNAQDADGDAFNYTLLIAPDFTFAAISKNYTNIVASYKTSDPLIDSDYFWKIAAIDSEGAIGGWSDVYMFIESQSPPLISSETISPSTAYNNDTVTISITATDSNGVSSVWISGNWTGEWVNYTVTANAGSTYSYQLGSGNLSNGKYISYRFYANNTGTEVTTGTVHTFSISNRAPHLFSDDTIPASPHVFNSTYIYFNVTDPDNDTIAWVNYSLYAPNGTRVVDNAACTNTNGYWNTSPLVMDDGMNWTWNLTASDSLAVYSTSGTVFVNDSEYPSLVLHLPTQSGTYTGTTIDLEYYVSDNTRLSSCWYYDNLVALTNTSISCSTNDTSFTVTTHGTHTFIFYVNDTSNNINYTEITYTSSASVVDGGGGRVSSDERVEYVYVEQPSGTECGNDICDYDKGEDAISCPRDCPWKLRDLPNNLRAIIGQAWFVKSGLLFMIIVFLLVLYDQSSKSVSKKLKIMPAYQHFKKNVQKIKIPKWPYTRKKRKVSKK